MRWALRDDWHRVRETEAVRFLRRELKDEDLISYFDVPQSRWVIAFWVDKQKRIVSSPGWILKYDLGRTMDEPPRITREFVQWMRESRRPTDFRAHKAAILEAQRNEERQNRDASEENSDFYKYAQKRTDSVVPYAFG